MRLLIRTCPAGTSLVVQCQHCYDTGRANNDPLDPNECGFCEANRSDIRLTIKEPT